MPSPDAQPALLIALPDGLSVSGVTMWAVRLVNRLAHLGRAAGLLLHAEPAGQHRLDLEIDPRVRLWDLSTLGDLRAGGQTIDACIDAYARAAHELAGSDGITVLSPNLAGNCYGVAAGTTRLAPQHIRVVGWQHSDIAYDARVLEWHEPCLSAIVGVSDAICDTLRERLPHRTQDLSHIPYGVDTHDTPPQRPPLRDSLRLIYTGRLEHHQKRVLALAAMSERLLRQGIAHTLTVAGDGPAADAFSNRTRASEAVRFLGPQSPEDIQRLLREHDALVLPSRFEGLSIAMLEAMATGCVPIVAGVRSGARQAVTDGINGILAEATPEMDDESAGLAMADAVARFATMDRASLSLQAWRRAHDRFGLGGHVRRVADLLDAIAHTPARPWPAARPVAFTGTVPPDGPERMRSLLASLRGRRIVLHGVGAHTRELWPIIEHSNAAVVAFTDDDRQHHGQRLFDRPILAPAAVATSGATDVVLSSWLHQDALWARRGSYERQGLTVHRVYP